MTSYVTDTGALGSELAAEVARSFGSLLLRVSGTSMVPAIVPGDVVVIDRAPVTGITPGEIVVFLREGRLIVHRVTKIVADVEQQPTLVTRGDRTRRDDPAVSSRELVGKVTHIERRGARMPAAPRLNWKQKVIGSVLRSSDRATYCYLRLVTS